MAATPSSSAESVKKVVIDTLLRDCLGAIKDPTGGGWRVLVLDKLTTRIMSSVLRMSDLADANISVVEDLDKAREPLNLAAVYFVQPTLQSVTRLVADFQRAPLYPTAHVFFTSAVPPEALAKIKACPALVQRLRTMKEVGLEFLTVDSRTIITDQPTAMVTLMGEHCEGERLRVEHEIGLMTMRLSTLLATLKEFPSIRYKVGKAPEPGDPPGQSARAVLTQRVASKVMERAMMLQRNGLLPAKETCDLLILDRSVDPVAPFMHEWTYEAMVYDLLETKGSTIRYAPNDKGKEPTDMPLDEHDQLWVEFRHMHIAEVFSTGSNRVKELSEHNAAAKYNALKSQQGGQPLSGAAMKGVVQAIPKFQDMAARLALHLYLMQEIRQVMNARKLQEIGELETDLVYGDKTSKDLINFLLEKKGELLQADKVRLFISYLATHPDKLDAQKRLQWQKVSALSAQDMAVVCNLAYLGVSVMKQPTTQSLGTMFGRNKKNKKNVRQQRAGKEDGFALSRFEPLLLDITESLASNKLPVDEYPYVRAPAEEDPYAPTAATSARTNRSVINWAKRPDAAGATSSRKIIVFVIGGVTRSEMRSIYQVAKSTNRDVILASTGIEKPIEFLNKLAALSTSDEMMDAGPAQ